MRIPKKVRVFVMGSGQRSVELIIGIGFVLFVLLFKLRSLIPNLSAAEFLAINASSMFDSILTNPVFAPHKLLQLGLGSIDPTAIFAYRLASTLFAILAVLAVYYILKRWYTLRISIIGTLLFTSSSWFLVYARQATPDIMFSLLVLLLAYGTWVRHTQRFGIAVILGALLFSLLAYTPGLIWILLIGLVWQWRQIVRLVKDAPRLSIVAGTILLLLLSPLFLAAINEPTVFREFAGLSREGTLSVSGFFQNIWAEVKIMFYNGPSDATQGLIGSALVDPFIIVMSLLGIYAYAYQRRLDRARMIFGGFVIGLVLIGLGGVVNSVILMPLIYLVAIAGIALMMQQWFTVFPRNPLARGIGILVILTAVFLSTAYQLDRYFFAWPNSRETKQVYTISLDS